MIIDKIRSSFHVFEIKNTYFLYLPNFKQLFTVDESEYIALKNCSNQYEGILTKYIGLTNAVDNIPEKEVDEDRYALFLNIANACNLSCIYCFANQGDYGKEKGIMSSKTACDSIDFCMESMPAEAHITVVFFGGEPLLAYKTITDVCDHINKNYKNKIDMRIVTNSTLLSEDMIDFFNLNNMSIAVSIDGGKDVHDSQRPFKNGCGSYFDVVKNYISMPSVSIERTSSNGERIQRT